MRSGSGADRVRVAVDLRPAEDAGQAGGHGRRGGAAGLVEDPLRRAAAVEPGRRGARIAVSGQPDVYECPKIGFQQRIIGAGDRRVFCGVFNVKDFRKLDVWHKSHALTLAIYKITRQFPQEELYGLTSQIRRACASIPTNLAEGCGHSSDRELAQFTEIAMGSASELEYLITLVFDLQLVCRNDFDNVLNQVVEIKKMLTALIKTLRSH